MEQRYWLRHPSLRGHQGPYSVPDLRRAIESGAFPRDSYLLADSGQSELDRMASPLWRPSYEVIGTDPPPPPPPPPIPPRRARDDAADRAHEALTRLRAGSAYPGLRALIQIAKWAVVLTIVLMTILGVVAGKGQMALALILWAVVQIVVVVVVAGMLQAILDIADRAVVRD